MSWFLPYGLVYDALRKRRAELNRAEALAAATGTAKTAQSGPQGNAQNTSGDSHD